jgi:hypothetical protein
MSVGVLCDETGPHLWVVEEELVCCGGAAAGCAIAELI